jgi:hypothetical protein
MSLEWFGLGWGQPWWDAHGRTTRRRRRRLAVASLIGVAIVEIGMLAAARPAGAAGTSVNLDQWASSDRAWQNEAPVMVPSVDSRSVRLANAHRHPDDRS